jgi:hypothetical protein
VIALLPALLGCGAPPAAAPAPLAAAPAAAPDLVLVGIAGLRSAPIAHAADAFLAPFAGEPGVVFTDAYASSPAPFVSLGSLLAGRYPSAVPLCGLPTDPGEGTTEPPWCNTFPATRPSLPTVLALYGYRTALVTADLAGVEHLAPLFQDVHVVSEHWTDTATDWARVEAEATAWWNADSSHPRLLVVATADLMVRTRPDVRAGLGLGTGKVPPGGGPDRGRPPLEGYRQAAQEAGRATKRLRDALSGGSRPLWSVLFGLNGVNLGETSVPSQALRERSWNDLLLDRTVHVPLALLGPVTGRTEGQVVELVDLVPTLTHLAGATAPAALPGQDLLAADFATDPAATAYAEFGDMLAVRVGRTFWSVRAFLNNRSSLDPELTNFVLAGDPDENHAALHDLGADPLQRRNLLASDVDGAKRMHTLLVGLRTGAGAPPLDALDARRIWELRMTPSEGYW